MQLFYFFFFVLNYFPVFQSKVKLPYGTLQTYYFIEKIVL